jgi:transcriptional regulator GlxA family with amidase domain
MWLADTNLLDGRTATTHHEYWDALAAMGANVRRGERVVDDGDLVTAGGITSGLFWACIWSSAWPASTLAVESIDLCRRPVGHAPSSPTARRRWPSLLRSRGLPASTMIISSLA